MVQLKMFPSKQPHQRPSTEFLTVVGHTDPRHSDPLPNDRGQLEGRLNHHISQLQGLAKEVEWVNEAIDMKKIVLQRLLRDPEVEVPSPGGNVKDKAKKDDKGKSKVKRSDSSKSSETELQFTGVMEMNERIAAFRKLKGSLGESVKWQLEEMGRVEKELGYSDTGKSKVFGKMEPGEFENIPTDRKWSKES